MRDKLTGEIKDVEVDPSLTQQEKEQLRQRIQSQLDSGSLSRAPQPPVTTGVEPPESDRIDLGDAKREEAGRSLQEQMEAILGKETPRHAATRAPPEKTPPPAPPDWERAPDGRYGARVAEGTPTLPADHADGAHLGDGVRSDDLRRARELGDMPTAAEIQARTPPPAPPEWERAPDGRYGPPVAPGTPTLPADHADGAHLGDGVHGDALRPAPPVDPPTANPPTAAEIQARTPPPAPPDWERAPDGRYGARVAEGTPTLSADHADGAHLGDGVHGDALKPESEVAGDASAGLNYGDTGSTGSVPDGEGQQPITDGAAGPSEETAFMQRVRRRYNEVMARDGEPEAIKAMERLRDDGILTDKQLDQLHSDPTGTGDR
jgi:hypothetical protein